MEYYEIIPDKESEPTKEEEKDFFGSSLLFIVDRFGLKYNFENILKYFYNTDKVLKQNAKDYEFMVESLVAETEDEFKESVYDDHYNEYKHRNDFTPDLFYKSSLIMMFSILDSRLQRICHDYEKEYPEKIKLKELRGSDFESYMIYFKKVIGIEVGDLNPLWMQIKQYQKVRNFIVHRNSSYKTIPNKHLVEQPDYEWLSKNSYLNVNTDYETFSIKNVEYVSDLCHISYYYLMKVMKRIDVLTTK